MKRSIFSAMMLASLAALAIPLASIGAEKPVADTARQGITGKVTKKKGNFMPGPAPEPGAPAPKRSEMPLAVPVHIFKGKVEKLDKPDPKHPSLVKIVQCDKDGVFIATLEPGEYTAVAEIAGKLYLNTFTAGQAGKLIWSTVIVKTGEWTKWNIEDTSEAAF